MKRVIYYFSGTGNSLYTAGKIAEAPGGAELISVRCIPKEVSAKDADIIGFVCPVYEWDVPCDVLQASVSHIPLFHPKKS